MIHLVKGDIFEAKVDVLVNPVNTEGVMGAGLAKLVRYRFPKAYEAWRKRPNSHIGDLVVVLSGVDQPAWIYNVPTKDRWRNPSRLSYITAAVDTIKAASLRYNIQSIAIPALGCGLGELQFDNVRPLIEKSFSTPETEKIEVFLYEPY